MEFNALPINENTHKNIEKVEKVLNKTVRGYDRFMGFVGLSGRKGRYDDHNFEFEGGAKDSLRLKHYDKSLRLLWKAEQHAPHTATDFKDLTKDEKAFLTQAKSALSEQEKVELERFSTEEYKAFINANYTQEQKQAIVNVLSLIAHGEAYAWMVSAEVLTDADSTGGRAAVTMQVLEEAMHFVVLRELLLSWECEIPRFLVWEYLVMERMLKSEGLEKFFGMNVVVENIAMGLFGMFGEMPGLEVLKMFHLDESRHCALPVNYFDEMPMTWWQKNNPISQVRRLSMVLPAIPMLLSIEKDMAILGVDSLEFGGSLVRKVLYMTDRVGFHLVIPPSILTEVLNDSFNLYAKIMREGHERKDFMNAETVTGEDMAKVEKEIFDLYLVGRKATTKASGKILQWRKKVA